MPEAELHLLARRDATATDKDDPELMLCGGHCRDRDDCEGLLEGIHRRIGGFGEIAGFDVSLRNCSPRRTASIACSSSLWARAL